MNRTQRRLEAKRNKETAKQISLLTQTEEKRLWFQQGFSEAVRASYASFASAMHEHGIDQDGIVEIMRTLDEKLMFYTGEDELIEEAFDKAGILLDFDGVFSSEKITAKEPS